ncbi:MAG: trypsin-like peptidase domain-containing protein [Salibacteraceae bacterium]
MKRIIVPLSSALIGGLIVAFSFNSNESTKTYKGGSDIEVKTQQVNYAPVPSPVPDLTVAAEQSLEAVVHVHTVFAGQEYPTSGSLFDLFYGTPQNRRAPEGTGSGVIISNNGYIVTNNHVVKGAKKVKITLHNKESYDAKIIGRDPSTDLALLKIEEEELPYLTYANSDDIKVGEWVLAVGNPFNLNSTVTAGIISAKGRDINILDTDPESGISPVESFIQTDAAVNPGNSGGALVNTRGELIGINAAIKSNTGSFMGYSFAIPANITKKVVSDLIEFGTVQRAFIGVSIQNINDAMVTDLNLESKDGIYIAGLAEEGSAKEAGIEVGDIITSVDEKSVTNVPELQEQISRFRPGNKVKIGFLRDGEPNELEMVLRNEFGNTDVVEKKEVDLYALLGADLSTASDKAKRRLGISYGVQVSELNSGKLMKAGVRENFIIRKVDGKRVNTPNDIINALSNKKGGVLFEGIYPNGRMAYYGVGL